MPSVGASLLAGLLALAAAQDVQPPPPLSTSEWIDYARAIAQGHGLDVTDTAYYQFSMLRETFAPGYTTILTDENGHGGLILLVNNSTGQAIEFDTCEIFDFPELRPWQDQFLNVSKANRKTPRELADDIGCVGEPKVTIKSFLAALKSGQMEPPLPTSDLIDLARAIARDNGYDVTATTLSIYLYPPQKSWAAGYTTMAVTTPELNSLQLMLNNSTGQVIDWGSCQIFNFPDLKPWQDKIHEIHNANPRTPQELADDVDCIRKPPKVLDSPVPVKKGR